MKRNWHPMLKQKKNGDLDDPDSIIHKKMDEKMYKNKKIITDIIKMMTHPFPSQRFTAEQFFWMPIVYEFSEYGMEKLEL